MQAQLADTIAKLQAEVDSLQPAREAAAAAVPPQAPPTRSTGWPTATTATPSAAIAKPDRRREEYLCTACNMELAIDIYNKLHSRDEIVFCPSCRRILYIPEDLTPEAAIAAPKATWSGGGRPKSAKKASGAAPAGGGGAEAAPPVNIEKLAKGDLGQLLAAAQGESVQAAVVSGSSPVECEVYVNNELAGYYKGRDCGHLERNIKYRLEQVGRQVELRVAPSTRSEEQSGNSAAAPEAPGIRRRRHGGNAVGSRITRLSHA